MDEGVRNAHHSLASLDRLIYSIGVSIRVLRYYCIKGATLLDVPAMIRYHSGMVRRRSKLNERNSKLPRADCSRQVSYI